MKKNFIIYLITYNFMMNIIIITDLQEYSSLIHFFKFLYLLNLIQNVQI